MRRGNACSWMVWTPPVRHSRSDTRAPANSIANTAASSANRPCGIFGLFALQALRRWSWLVTFRTWKKNLLTTEERGIGTRPAVLYALDAKTGKLLYQSGDAKKLGPLQRTGCNRWTRLCG